MKEICFPESKPCELVIKARNRYWSTVKYYRRQKAVGIFCSLLFISGAIAISNPVPLFMLPFSLLMIFSKERLWTETTYKSKK